MLVHYVKCHYIVHAGAELVPTCASLLRDLARLSIAFIRSSFSLSLFDLRFTMSYID